MLDRATLTEAMTGQDVVYANLASDMKRQPDRIAKLALTPGREARSSLGVSQSPR